MICKDCRNAGEVLKTALAQVQGAVDLLSKTAIQTIHSYHKLCPGKTGCDCQHKIEAIQRHQG